MDTDRHASKDEPTLDLSLQLGNVSIAAANARAADDMPRLKCEEEPDNHDFLLSADPLPALQPNPETLPAEDPHRSQQQQQPSITAPRRLPRTGITEDGKLIPPPKDAKYGPAAEPPLESCRPGGPRLYDLLNELSLEPFGVMTWAIVESEEVTFEQDDLIDEDKVMLALWNRWIMLNRSVTPAR